MTKAGKKQLVGIISDMLLTGKRAKDIQLEISEKYEVSGRTVERYITAAYDNIAKLDIVEKRALKVIYKGILQDALIEIKNSDLRADKKLIGIVSVINTLMKLDGLHTQKHDITSDGKPIDMSTNINIENKAYIEKLDKLTNEQLFELYDAQNKLQDVEIKLGLKPPSKA